MVTLHEVITFLVSMQISISSLQTHNVNRCGRSRHLARKLSLRRKRSSPNVFEMAATEKIGRASCRERVEIAAVAEPFKKKRDSGGGYSNGRVPVDALTIVSQNVCPRSHIGAIRSAFRPKR